MTRQSTTGHNVRHNRIERVMSENTKTLTTAQHVSAIKRAHVAAGKGQHAAGLAVFHAESAGMLTFDRPVKGSPIAEGVVTRSGLAKVLGCSPTLVSKYRGIGRLSAVHGVTPDHADSTFAYASAATAWMTEALATGDTEAVVQAIADHRPGSQSKSGGQKGKATKGTKKPTPASAKVTPVGVTRQNVEAHVSAVVKWITRNDGKSLDGLSTESLETIHALLMSAGESVEAAQVRKGTLSKVA